MINTSFHFRQTFLLSARSSQSHTTSCSSLMSHHQVNYKCNRVKGQHWRWLIYELSNFLLGNVICFQKQPPNLESFTNSTGKHLCWSLFFLKMMKLYKDICSAWISHTSAEFFFYFYFTKNTSMTFEKWFMKMLKKIFISQHTYLHIYGSQTFWSFMKFYFVHIVEVYFAFKK